MPKLRLFILLLTFIILGIFGTIAILFARGFRLNLTQDNVSLSQKGLLLANSDPNGAQVYVDGDLKTATNNTVSLDPGVHNVVVKKEGFLDWQKEIVIEKEVVTQVNAFLVPTAPSLSALTLTGAINPTANKDLTKLAYVVPQNTDQAANTATRSAQANTSEETKEGLWVLEMSNLPLGFSRDPKRVTEGNLTNASIRWSPDGRQILLTQGNNSYLLDVSEFTPSQELQSKRIINTANLEESWQEESNQIVESQLDKLPDQIQELFLSSANNLRFSPDEDKILYTATGSATIPDGLIKPLPGSSTQPQERNIAPNNQYVYDFKEDRNFKVGTENDLIMWMPNSLNLLIPGEETVFISDYDGQNKQTVFTGSFTYPEVFPSGSTGRIIISTNFGSQSTYNNLYWLGLK